ncbi:UbiA prenyltransferase family-domain-containing protein [Suillus paluster]|uniref:UbiA prenyltransferase family-domain-containing protein n=1 Tax=Suillus paluster TaxID=48578 RepID=UPI001B85EEB3|nr:UbiA prenyltransferase family-domain-containing protein [Suillus paluster]KAG1725354.1 UbiA prenyltransferase family-domain-containing protein [Suillus paluster]
MRKLDVSHPAATSPSRLRSPRNPPLPGPKPPPGGFKEVEVLTPRRLLKIYAQLAKSRLTFLVVLTAMSGVALSPLPATVPILLSTAVGTALCSASANTLNQLQEIPYDAQMARTRQRPLVRRAISPLHAAGFAAVTGVAGPAVLWFMASPLAACLGAANIVLYAVAYTWLKRKSVSNTWVGAVVGGIPPLMGWTACGGQLLPTEDYPIHLFLPSFLTEAPLDMSMIDNPLGAFALFMLLYSWQFPHFNSLSHFIRGSYAQAGYKMLCVLNPQKNALVALRHSLLLVPICSIMFPLSGLTTWAFAVTSLVPNAICIRGSWNWWRRCGEKEARVTFQHYLWYLPVMLALMMVHKQGLDWRRWWRETFCRIRHKLRFRKYSRPIICFAVIRSVNHRLLELDPLLVKLWLSHANIM